MSSTGSSSLWIPPPLSAAADEAGAARSSARGATSAARCTGSFAGTPFPCAARSSSSFPVNHFNFINFLPFVAGFLSELLINSVCRRANCPVCNGVSACMCGGLSRLRPSGTTKRWATGVSTRTPFPIGTASTRCSGRFWTTRFAAGTSFGRDASRFGTSFASGFFTSGR
jgi:hypothetical protein